jgi:molybdate/tungstate transport system substrate-binding protein
MRFVIVWIASNHKVYYMRYLLLSALILLMTVIGCKINPKNKSTEIIIFHAGSLSVPIKNLSLEYEKRNPGIKILSESSGSLIAARKVSEVKKACDIVAVSDNFVINEILIPQYASWSIRFATNEIVIAYSDRAKYSSELNSSNWIDILSKDDVIYARADPNADPCGYRTVMMFMLAEKYYGISGLSDKMVSKNTNFIRSKEVDLVGLVEANAIDYMFQYKSVAIQHNLKYLELPKEINLGDPLRNDLYKSVSMTVNGNSPDSKIIVTGDYINYSLTLIKDAPHSKEAIDFILFLLSKEGLDIIRKSGQEPLVPCRTEQPEQIPDVLKTKLSASN